MTHSDLARLDGLVANIGPLPIDPIWMYEVIRHAQRNMDFDVAEGFCEPDRYAGSPIGELINEFPALLARVRELESVVETIANHKPISPPLAHIVQMRRIARAALTLKENDCG